MLLDDKISEVDERIYGSFIEHMRRKNGHEEPHGFKVWCLGNEMDGPWQTCQMTAEDYAKKAKETAKILKWVDPEIEVVACGSSSKEMPTFPEWDLTVMDMCYDQIDFILLHRYYEYNGNVGDFLASFHDLDDFIRTVRSAADYVKAKHRGQKDIKLILDEWNVWYIKDMDTKRWQHAPAIAEDVYSLLDALVVGGDVLRHTTYYPFMQVSNNARGSVYKSLMVCDKMETPKYGKVPLLQSVATFDEEKGSGAFFVLNADQNDSMELELDYEAFGDLRMVERQVLQGSDLFAVNTLEEPEKVVPAVVEVDKRAGSTFKVELPPLSWTMLIFEKAN